MVEMQDILFYMCAIFTILALFLFLIQKSNHSLKLALGVHTASIAGLLFILGADWVAFFLLFLIFSMSLNGKESRGSSNRAKSFILLLGLVFVFFIIQAIIRPAWNITLSEERLSSTVAPIGLLLTKQHLGDFSLISLFILVFILTHVYRKAITRDR